MTERQFQNIKIHFPLGLAGDTGNLTGQMFEQLGPAACLAGIRGMGGGFNNEVHLLIRRAEDWYLGDNTMAGRHGGCLTIKQDEEGFFVPWDEIVPRSLKNTDALNRLIETSRRRHFKDIVLFLLETPDVAHSMSGHDRLAAIEAAAKLPDTFIQALNEAS